MHRIQACVNIDIFSVFILEDAECKDVGILREAESSHLSYSLKTLPRNIYFYSATDTSKNIWAVRDVLSSAPRKDGIPLLPFNVSLEWVRSENGCLYQVSFQIEESCIAFFLITRTGRVYLNPVKDTLLSVS